MKLTIAFLLVYSCLYLPKANSIVDMKNANYADTWTDLIVPGTGYDLKVRRTYNSRSLFNGVFGFGWCSDFETALKITAEGNIQVTECGGGLEVMFTPRNFSPEEVNQTVSKIIARVKQDDTAKDMQSEKAINNLTANLKEDLDLRSKYAARYGIALPIKEGTIFFANGREVENFVFKSGYYTRNFADGTSQRFNKEGQVTHIYDKNNNFLKFEYDKSVIREVADNNGRKLSFKYYNNKKVKSITGPQGTSVEYKFKNMDDLIEVKNVWGNTYTYEYDEFHNLTKINFPDKTYKALTYNTQKDWVMSFRNRDTCIENYQYEGSKDDSKNHYWSLVEKRCEEKL